MDWMLILQIVGTLLGLFYLWLEYKANIWVWVIGAIMPMVHGMLYLKAGIYADAAMQLYYVAAGIYGLVVWRGIPKKSKMFPLTYQTLKSTLLPLKSRTFTEAFSPKNDVIDAVTSAILALVCNS